MLALARQRLRREKVSRLQIRLIRSDAKTLPFDDASFDAIISNSLLHHIPDPRPLWKEIRRVAKPNAAILVQDLFRPSSRTSARKLMKKHCGHESKLLQQLFYQSLLAAFRPAEIRTQLRVAKLSRLRVSTIDDRHVVIDVRL